MIALVLSTVKADNPEYQKKTLDMVNSFDEGAAGVHPHDDHDVDKLDYVTMKRMVLPKKGKWLRFSREVINEVLKDKE